MRRHSIITGTGRTGTSFLVQLLTKLGLDTGFEKEDIYFHLYENARAGLERDVRDDDAPYIVKSPFFCDHAPQVLQRDDISIDYVFVPMRDLQAAAESRRYVVSTSLTKRPDVPGGLWHTERGEDQEAILVFQVYKLFLALSNTEIPIILMKYPKITQDSEYLYRKMNPLLEGIDYQKFRRAFKDSVNPDWVHSFNQNDV
jgi:hypothetical protein